MSNRSLLTIVAMLIAAPLAAFAAPELPSVSIDADAVATSEAPTPVCTTTDEAYLVDPAFTLQQALIGGTSWKRDDIVTIPKFGGYIIGSYKYDSGQRQTRGDGFNLRLVRLYVDGTVMKDFKYRLQMEVNGTPHIKDATLEWVHWRFLQLKAGQFKRCFTYENPYNPWDVGAGDYSQLVKKLAGMGDRVGEKTMGGRDLGFQIAGDLLPSPRDKHTQLHYQVAAYNGQGINQKDENRTKDFIGTLQWSPIKHLSLGAFGWMGKWYDRDGKHINLDRKRYAFGLKYENPDNGWSARAEWARSYGHKASDWGIVKPGDDTTAPVYGWTTDTPRFKGGDKADAWYATVGIPVWRWIKIYAKYDAYRDYMTWDSMHSIYTLTANLQPHKNLMLQLQYNFNDDRTTTAPRQYYHQAWAQMYVRF